MALTGEGLVMLVCAVAQTAERMVDSSLQRQAAYRALVEYFTRCEQAELDSRVMVSVNLPVTDEPVHVHPEYKNR
jgi:hypothetical protein